MFVLAAALSLHLIPLPQSVQTRPCSVALTEPLRVERDFDAAALDEINERWKALGIPSFRRVEEGTGGTGFRIVIRPGSVSDPYVSDVSVQQAALPPQAYRLHIAHNGAIEIQAGDSDGAFYAAMTLAQLPQRVTGKWFLPCVDITDAPALKWRVLSDDVSRGPLPNMRYFKERIRTIAAFKMNGYSPYMEHVFVDPRNPLAAPLDGITPAQLRELAAYAKRYHVTFIPEQQTFAHMHGALALEKYATAAEFQHDFLLSPASPLSLEYLTQLIQDELAAVPHPVFFHIGSDETSTLGQGQSKTLAAQRGLSSLFAEHVRLMNNIIAPSGARVMLWDDAIEKDPAIMSMIPKSAVIINWHYGADNSFTKYINVIASGGLEQMVAPGANNWNQIYPDIHGALVNEQRFVDEGKNAHVLGLFQTVWHDDGETLFEATWYPLLYSAANAWEHRSVDPVRFQQDFPAAFFGVDDARYGSDIAALTDIQARLAGPYSYSSDYLFWADPFDPRAAAFMQKVDIRALRLDSEVAQQHLLQHTPPLHANAAQVMFLAARKYDFIGRKFQAAQEVRDYYAEAQAGTGQPHSPTDRDLLWCKYWFWELRDRYEELEPLYAAAWRYENRESHLASNLERYHLAAQQNIERADRFNAVALDHNAGKPLPPLDVILNPSVPL
ncbi:MAG TPA: glycoside hydrolase family 20 zincin-like fold domain-containing protein [Candidatus Rubrimentiphilum sp.]|nr:glycoside hydrolase family 20 zincin-like fold domain-containing protein [Candidatus Rubrimentiphilum sp.]